MSHDVRGTIERQRHLFRGHPAEVVHLDDFGKRGFFAFKCFEGSVEVQELDVLGRMLAGDLEARLPGDAFLAAASLGGDVRARGINEDLPHHPRHQGQKVHAIRDLRFAILKQLEKRFVHERGWLQRVLWRLPPHERARDSTQLCVDERHQLVERRPIAVTHAVEETRHLCHGSVVELGLTKAPTEKVLAKNLKGCRSHKQDAHAARSSLRLQAARHKGNERARPVPSKVVLSHPR